MRKKKKIDFGFILIFFFYYYYLSVQNIKKKLAIIISIRDFISDGNVTFEVRRVVSQNSGVVKANEFPKK